MLKCYVIPSGPKHCSCWSFLGSVSVATLWLAPFFQRGRASLTVFPNWPSDVEVVYASSLGGWISFWTSCLLKWPQAGALLARFTHQASRSCTFDPPTGQVVWFCTCSLLLFPLCLSEIEWRTTSQRHTSFSDMYHVMIGLLKFLSLIWD